jgi:hypothetical protein
MKHLFQQAAGRRRAAAFTLVEVMITLGIATMFVVGVITFTTITFRQGIFAIGNYTDLNNRSRKTLDIMSRDIRNASGLVYYTASSIKLTNDDGSEFRYEWDGTDKFTRSSRNPKAGAYYWKPTIMMTNCDFMRFNIYQRNPTNNFNFVSAAGNWNQTKLIDVSWRCSRTYLGSKLNTESVQTARIVMRN